jgi:hypothetical protein
MPTCNLQGFGPLIDPNILPPPDPQESNEDRAEAAQRAIEAFALDFGEINEGRDFLQQNVQDLLCDLGHLFDRVGLDLSGILSSAKRQYDEETSFEGKQFGFIDEWCVAAVVPEIAAAVIVDDSKSHISLPDLIRTAARVYDPDEYPEGWDHLIDVRGKLLKKGEMDDPLVEFIIAELGNTYDPLADRAGQIEVAVQAMRLIGDQVQDVAIALADLSDE